MPPRTRVLALRCQPQHDPRRLSWIVLASLTLAAAGFASAAYGQGSPIASDAVPPATAPTTPAEIQPGHPASNKPAIIAPGKGGSGPQTAVPAPLPPRSGADTPGGSAKNGVIAPPPGAGDRGIDKGAPSVGTMSVIPPPGAPGNNSHIVPK